VTNTQFDEIPFTGNRAGTCGRDRGGGQTGGYDEAFRELYERTYKSSHLNSDCKLVFTVV